MIHPEASYKQDHQECWSDPCVEEVVLDDGPGLPVRYRCKSVLLVEIEAPVVTIIVVVLGKLELDRPSRVRWDLVPADVIRRFLDLPVHVIGSIRSYDVDDDRIIVRKDDELDLLARIGVQRVPSIFLQRARWQDPHYGNNDEEDPNRGYYDHIHKSSLPKSIMAYFHSTTLGRFLVVLRQLGNLGGH